MTVGEKLGYTVASAKRSSSSGKKPCPAAAPLEDAECAHGNQCTQSNSLADLCQPAVLVWRELLLGNRTRGWVLSTPTFQGSV